MAKKQSKKGLLTGDQSPQAITITSPAHQAQFTAGEIRNRSVDLVIFEDRFNGGLPEEVHRITDPRFPIEWNWSNPRAGGHSLLAKAYLTDSHEPLVTGPVNFIVQGSIDPAGIILDSPRGGNVFQAPAPIPVRIEADQALAGRSVTSIRIFDVHEDGETKEVHSENNPTFPLDWPWTDPKLGLHVGMYAVAILSDGTPLRTDNGDPANRPRFRYQPAGN